MRLPWGLRWWELLPELALGAGLALFLATEPSAATSAFRSATAVTLMVTVGVAWIVLRIVLVRYTTWPALRLTVFSAAAAAVLLVVVAPAYDDTTVVEALPTATAEVDQPTPSTTVGPSTDPAPPPPPPPTTTTTSTPGPIAVRSSPLHGIDHRATGTAVIYRQPDGSLVVGLEDIDIQPGPDYDVYVVPGADRQDTSDGLRLDDLRGNIGTQYYPVPNGTDVTSGPWTVLVWCTTFDVPVAGATPT